MRRSADGAGIQDVTPVSIIHRIKDSKSILSILEPVDEIQLAGLENVSGLPSRVHRIDAGNKEGANHRHSQRRDGETKCRRTQTKYRRRCQSEIRHQGYPVSFIRLETATSQALHHEQRQNAEASDGKELEGVGAR